MCGIAGLIDLVDRRAPDRALVEKMTNSLAHRGPDANGFHLEPGVGLGHRRLSIIDLSGGKQPLYNEDGTVVVTYNGEIYNYLEITRELQAKGHTFKTVSDTEAIVHAWEEWGEASVERFNGMFAYAIWDANRRQAFLARDRLGIKPLYYAVTDDGFLVFGSELKALLVHPGVARGLDVTAIADFFTFGYVPEPKTIFSRVHKLSPGETICFKHGKRVAEPRRYWDLAFVERPASKGTEEELVARLKTAVELQLVSEVPLGAFLSGGVDSSAVVAMMSELSAEPVRTCSISFGDPKFNESAFADLVAKKFGARHNVEQVEPSDFSLLDSLAGLYDEPFADSSAIPTYRVCELARKSVTVALSGDGGDENFAGYRRYRWHMNEESLRQRLPLGLRRPVFGSLGALYPKLDWAPRFLRAKTTFQALARDSVSAYLHSVALFPPELRHRILSADLERQLGGYESRSVFERYLGTAPKDPLSLVQYLDFKTYLPGDILTKVDRASMAHGLEVRVPLLDHTFVEWVAGLPPTEKLHGGVGKYVFKRALEPKLPNEILYRSKMGFAVPIVDWFRGPLRATLRESILGGGLRESGMFDHGFLTRLVDQHQSGARDFSPVLWALLMFERFYSRVA
jgi:asparagine synthase (glutamine-hydrolysing)